ncbi:unnamed protein product, partial [Scytosiphon promiscuus]
FCVPSLLKDGYFMSRSRADFEGDAFDGASPVGKKQRLVDSSGNSSIPGDDTGFRHHTSYGTGHHEDDGGGSTFAINYEDGDFEDDDNDGNGDGDIGDAEVGFDGAVRPDGVGESGAGDAVGGRKSRNRPWKVHGRRAGGSMHDANLYRHYRPDFRELAREYPETFGPHVRDDPDTGRATVDWADPAAMRELTRVMLRHDFGLLEWDAPLDRLCPPVANRLNYVCWLSDLMKLSSSSQQQQQQRQEHRASEDAAASSGGGGGRDGPSGAGEESAGMTAAQRNLLLFGTATGVAEEEEDEAMSVCGDDAGGDGDGRPDATAGCPSPRRPRCRGVDIGTGASCIYPLLGAKVAGWSFLATEIDAVSAEWAEKNVRSNGLQDQVTVRLVPPFCTDEGDKASPRGPLLTALRDEDGDFDFSMTNPPFFESTDEAGQNPETATGDMATAGEVACPGGEVAFVRAIIEDSLRLRERVRWYTSMVGKKSNAKKLLRILREAGVKNTRTTEFFQGRTVRWGLAWSFTSEGMVGDKVPDDPSVKVFSKKKAADRSQHSLRSFSVPLRPPPSSTSTSTAVAAATAAVAAGTPAETTPAVNGNPAGAGTANPVVKITVPANLPKDADDVVERLKCSMMAFKQAEIKVESDEDQAYASDPIASGARRFRCEAHPCVLAGKKSLTAPSAQAAAAAIRATTPTPTAVATGAAGGTVTAATATGTDTSTSTAPLFTFELEVHCAAEWAGAAAAQAAVQVWARLEDGSDRGAFQRLWEALQMDVLRQNRRWRREMTRDAAGVRSN